MTSNLFDIVEPDWISSSFSTTIFRSYIFDIDTLAHIITVTRGIIQSCIAMSENIYLQVYIAFIVLYKK